MVRPTELVAGNCYFYVNYHDEDLRFPSIQTLEYLSVVEDAADARRLWVFRDFGGVPVSDEEDADNEVNCGFDDDQLHGILDFAGLIRVLNGVAIDHPIHPPPAHPGPASESDLGDLNAQLEQFFQTPAVKAVTITIEFTDDGLSLSKGSDGTIDLSLFPHPRLDPDEEPGLRAACLAAGLTPMHDYLADRGRTRILAYAVPPDAVMLAKLAARIFLDVYGMRRGDTLRYQFRSAGSEPDGATSA